jgi:hypothetical protein
MTADTLGLDLYDDPEGRDFRLRNAPRIRHDVVTGTQVRTRPDGTVEVRYGDGTVDISD